MKIFKSKEQVKKHWALSLLERDGRVTLEAVDQNTGYSIGILFEFNPDGSVYAAPALKSVLQDEGYDPYEHGNSFTKEGSINIIEEEL